MKCWGRELCLWTCCRRGFTSGGGRRRREPVRNSAKIGARLLGEQLFPAGPGVGVRFSAGFGGIGSFAGAHETVAGALVDYRLVGFFGVTCSGGRFRNPGLAV